MENEKEKGNTGKGRLICRKGILVKSNFNLEGNVKWERDCYMDIMGVYVCACKVEREKMGRKLRREKKKKRSLKV